MTTHPMSDELARARGVTRAPFGVTADGTAVERFEITNANGVRIAVLSFGAVIQSIHVPDRHGAFDDVTLGYDTLAGYEADKSYFGALVGRVANRIGGGRFALDGREYQLALNVPPTHLHGGMRGFNKAVWRAEPLTRDDGVGVALEHVSPDGDEGYPGTLRAHVEYTLTDRNQLVVDYRVTTDAPTPVNLSQHSYFNLLGAGKGQVLGHEIQLAASRITAIDETLVPTGELRPVQGTPFDFRDAHPIGERITQPDEQLRIAGGFDHNFALDRPDDDSLVVAARLYEPTTGRGVDVHTTKPGIQFYTGNFLNGSAIGKGGRPYEYRTGLALETQQFPDSPNHPEFPSSILRPGEEHRSRTVYHFVVRES